MKKLWYLINGVVDGSYEVKIFCDEFYRIYNFETDKTQLTDKEKSEFEELFCMVARFSEFEEDLKIPNVYFSKEEVLAKAKKVQNMKSETKRR